MKKIYEVFQCEYCDWINRDAKAVEAHEASCLCNAQKYRKIEVYRFTLKFDLFNLLVGSELSDASAEDYYMNIETGKMYRRRPYDSYRQIDDVNADIDAPVIRDDGTAELYTTSRSQAKAYKVLYKCITEWFEQYKQRVAKGLKKSSWV